MSDRDRQDSHERGQFGGSQRGGDNQASQWQTDAHRQQGGDWDQASQRGASREDTGDYRFSGQSSALESSSRDWDSQGRADEQAYGSPQRLRTSSGGDRSQLNDDHLRNDQRDASRNYEQSRSSYPQHNDRGQQDWQREVQSNSGQRSNSSGYRIGNFDASGGNDFGNFTSEDSRGRDFSNRTGGTIGGGMRSSESYRPSYGLSSWFNNDDDERGGAQDRSGRNAGHEEYGSWRQYGESRGFLKRAGDEVASWFGDEDASRRREQDHREGNQGQGQTQSHRGRGPSNYTRSDERIREDANDHLTHDHHVDASHISVSVKDGELMLDGTVQTRAEKRRAEDAVDHISGVKHVQNNLRVQDSSSASGRSGGSYNDSASGSSPSYGQGSSQGSNSPAASGASGQFGSSGSSTSAASGSSSSLGTAGTPGSDTGSPGQTGASTTSGVGSTASAGVGSASTMPSGSKTS